MSDTPQEDHTLAGNRPTFAASLFAFAYVALAVGTATQTYSLRATYFATGLTLPRMTEWCLTVGAALRTVLGILGALTLLAVALVPARFSLTRRDGNVFYVVATAFLANLLALVSAGICDRIDRVSLLESADTSGYDSPETELPVGFAQPITNPELPDMVRNGTAVFRDAVQMMADALHVEIDEIICEPSFAVAPQDLDLGYMKIPEGCVAGIEASWQGRVADRAVIDLRVRWRKGQHLEPDWEIEHGYLIEIEGRPCVKTKLEIRPPKDFEAKSFADFMMLGMIMTGMPAVNAIPAVCAAAPGIRTYADLPLITGAGLVRTGP